MGSGGGSDGGDGGTNVWWCVDDGGCSVWWHVGGVCMVEVTVVCG